MTVSEDRACHITGAIQPLAAGADALRLPNQQSPSDVIQIVAGQILEVGNSPVEKESVVVTAVDQITRTVMFTPGLQYWHSLPETGSNQIRIVVGPTAKNQYCNGQQDHAECSTSHTFKAWSPVSWPEYACGYHEAHVRAAAKPMRVDELGRSCDTLECMRQYWTRLAERHGLDVPIVVNGFYEA